MSAGDFLTNQFLIAMPAMTDSNFAQTVTVIWEHNAEGALGIINVTGEDNPEVYKQVKGLGMAKH